MMISFSAYKPPPPENFSGGLINVENFIIPRQRRKDKAVVVMGATGAGKSRLSVDLAARFGGEVINSDKMQLYKGLNILTNKISDEERGGVPHHLIGEIEPEADFSAHDFVRHASAAAAAITSRGRLPIIAGGSNSFVKALVSDDVEFRSRYDCCFLWVDVEMSVLESFVSDRVDRMVESGLVEEAAEFFDEGGDYRRGIRRAIGVPELDEYFRRGGQGLLESAIEEIKGNTRSLAGRQLQKILQLAEHLVCRMHRLDATEAFLRRGEAAGGAWEKRVAGPATRILGNFLCQDFVPEIPTPWPYAVAGATCVAAVAAATR